MVTVSQDPFRVLIVCTANLCRSPMAEHLLRAALRDLAPAWTVGSAGTHARSGQPMHEASAAVLRERGVPTEPGWRSRLVDPDLIGAADLILTAETAHRSRVVTMAPAAMGRTFPLLQFARLAAHAPPAASGTSDGSGASLLDSVRAARTLVQPATGGADDVDDPIGHRRRAFRSCADVLGAAIESMLAPLKSRAEPDGSAPRRQ